MTVPTKNEIDRRAERKEEQRLLRLYELGPNDTLRAKVDRHLMYLYVYCPEADRVFPVYARPGEKGMKLSAFRTAMQKHSQKELAHPVTRWTCLPSFRTVKGLRMRPDKRAPIFEDEDGNKWINTYRPPAHDAKGGSADIGIEFIKMQIAPNAEERDYVFKWLAYKFRHPEVRGAALVMVAHNEFGTGRGMFGQLLKHLFGGAYWQSIDYAKLTGQNYQAQYNDWMSDNLIVCVDESAEVETGSTPYRTKVKVYERLKVLADPGKNDDTITRKSDPSTKELVFVSFVIATNHKNALPIPEGDRRFAVITNGEPQEQEYWDRLAAWMECPANVAAFADYLLAYDLTGYSPHRSPPMFEGKLAMIEAAKSDLERGVEVAVERIKGDVFTLDQVIHEMEGVRTDYKLQYPEGPGYRWQHTAREAARSKLKRVGVSRSTNWEIKIGKVKVPVYAKTKTIAAHWETRKGLRYAVLAGDVAGVHRGHEKDAVVDVDEIDIDTGIGATGRANGASAAKKTDALAENTPLAALKAGLHTLRSELDRMRAAEFL